MRPPKVHYVSQVLFRLGSILADLHKLEPIDFQTALDAPGLARAHRRSIMRLYQLYNEIFGEQK